MTTELNLSKLKVSLTKYDIVQVMDVVSSEDRLDKFINKEVKINESILKSFLGIKSLDASLPNYWFEIFKYPSNEKKLFALFSVIFMHGSVIEEFSNDYSHGNMKGTFKVKEGKKYTNLRSALVESGAALPEYRKMKEVPFDFTPIFQDPEIGQLFKKLLEERIIKILGKKPSENDFYEICYSNNFHKALSVRRREFEVWLGRQKDEINEKNREYRFIDKVQISNFFCIDNIHLDDISGSKEVYFLGENGDGKSLILMAIYLAFNQFFISNETNKEKTGKVVDIVRDNKKRGMGLVGIDSLGKEYANINAGFLNNFFAYGTHRGRYATDNPEQYGFMSLFDSEQKLTNPSSWLKDLRLIELENKSLRNDKNLPSNLSVKNLKSVFYKLLEKSVEIEIEGDEVYFKERGARLTFDQLSEGYKSIMIFVSDLLRRLQEKQPEIVNIEEFQGIVLVDEIDLHLHPKWKRGLVGKLRSLLPNIQFIFTTHSPTIIQGASDDAVIYRVFRNSTDGKTKVSDPYFRKDLNHLMLNTLLTSPLFGIEDSRLDADNDDADTSETYLLYRINRILKSRLQDQKRAGKEFLSDQDIDQLIKEIMEEELS